MSQLATHTPDPNLPDGIARAERRRVKLEALSDMGMVMSQEICNRWVDGPYHPEPKHDQGRSFAWVSRAVRLTLVLEARVDEQILALRNGVIPALKPWGSDRAGGSPVSAASGPAAAAREGGSGDQSTESLRESFEREADGLDEDESALIESEADDERLADDYDTCVDVIRADLGLPPLQEEERLGDAERGGDVIIHPKVTADPDVPTPDFAALRLDPLHEGGGGAAPDVLPPPQWGGSTRQERAGWGGAGPPELSG